MSLDLEGMEDPEAYFKSCTSTCTDSCVRLTRKYRDGGRRIGSGTRPALTGGGGGCSRRQLVEACGQVLCMSLFSCVSGSLVYPIPGRPRWLGHPHGIGCRQEAGDDLHG